MHFSTIALTVAITAGSVTNASPHLYSRGLGKLCKSADNTEFGVCRLESAGCSGGSFKDLDGWACSSGSRCCVYPIASANYIATASNKGRMNQNGINLIKSTEGLELSIYPDQHGVPTIGYGHNCAVHGCPLSTITEAQAEQYLRDDLSNPANRYESMVCELPGAAGLNENQFAALVDFAFNLGAWGAEKYLKTVFTGDLGAAIEGVKNNILSWSPIDNRRERELALFNTYSATLSGCGGSGGIIVPTPKVEKPTEDEKVEPVEEKETKETISDNESVPVTEDDVAQKESTDDSESDETQNDDSDSSETAPTTTQSSAPKPSLESLLVALPNGDSTEPTTTSSPSSETTYDSGKWDESKWGWKVYEKLWPF